MATGECEYVLSDVGGHPFPYKGKVNEFNDLGKPDGLRFVREAQFERFRNGLITPRIRVRTLYKGAWKGKGTLSGAFR